jgi:hypothetical protein
MLTTLAGSALDIDSAVHNLSLGARFHGTSLSPLVALVLPLDDNSDSVDFGLIFSLNVPL